MTKPGTRCCRRLDRWLRRSERSSSGRRCPYGIVGQNAGHPHLAAEILRLIESDPVFMELWERLEAMSEGDRARFLAIAKRHKGPDESRGSS